MSKKNTDMEKDLSVISPYIGGLWVESITGVVMLLLIGISGVYIFSNLCKKSDINKDIEKNHVIQTDTKDRERTKDFQSSNQEQKLRPTKKSQNPDLCMDVIVTALKAKMGDSSLNLSVKGHQNLNTRSDCFWFIILYMIVLCLVLISYFIFRSSKESRLLQFVIDWNEQKKEM